MTDPWIRVHSNVRSLTVVWRAVECLGLPPDSAVGLLVILWGQVAQHSENGRIDNVPDAQLEGWVGWSGEPGKFARFIREKHITDGRIREWDDYAGKLEERREKDRERKRLANLLRNSNGRPEEVRRKAVPTRAARNEDVTRTEERAERMRDLNSGSIPEDPNPLGLERTAPPAPLASLPPMAERLVEQVYGLSTEKRRLDVRRQLYETIADPGRGARIRRGVYVKARSADHLNEVCRAVLDDLPREVDAAIVFVLRKLQDPPPGPSPTDVAAADTAKQVALEDEYHAAQRRAGLEWARTHDEEFQKLRRPIDAEFGDQTNAFARLARDVALAQAAARAAGFPSFDEWRQQPAGAA